MKNIPSIIDGIEFIVNDKIKVTSKEIAEKFNKKHYNILRAIHSLECSETFTQLNFEFVEIIDKNAINGKINNSFYNITQNGFMFLVMGFTGKKASKWKENFIKAFNKMEKYLIAEEKRKNDRAIAAMNAPEMTEALLNHRAELGKKTKPFHYSNEFNMINKIVLGLNTKKWCVSEGITKENFRDSLTPVQIEAVENLQTANTVLIETGMDYKIRKDKLTVIYDKKFASRCLKEIVTINA